VSQRHHLLGRNQYPLLALLSPAGELVDVADMPVLRDGPASKRAVNPALLAAIIRKWQPSQAFVEMR
jgi:hypothetical protein